MAEGGGSGGKNIASFLLAQGASATSNSSEGLLPVDPMLLRLARLARLLRLMRLVRKLKGFDVSWTGQGKLVSFCEGIGAGLLLLFTFRAWA